MIVVDTNVIAYLFIEGDNTSQVQSLWRQDPYWRLPVLWKHEFLNVLSTYVRAGGMPLIDAGRIWHSAISRFAAMEQEIDFTKALRLAVEREMSAYDAQFVVLAQVLEVPLVSEDKELRKKCDDIVASLDEFIGP